MEKSLPTISAMLLSMLATASNFECTTTDLGDATDDASATTCCRLSEDFGLHSCDDGISSPRELLASFTIPILNANIKIVDDIFEAIGGKYGILYPDATVQNLGNRSICYAIALGSIISFLIYHIILRSLSKQLQPIKTVTAATIIMTLVFAPYYYIEKTNIQNSAVRAPFCLAMLTGILRTMEAYFGFTPKEATHSYWIYWAYFSSMGEIVFDRKTSKPAKATGQDILRSFGRVIRLMCLTTLVHSFMCHFDYMPFGPTRAGRFDESASLRDYFDPRHIGNCFFIALWFQQTLAYGEAAFALIMNATVGYKVATMMNNPLFGATSVRDFWSERWNILIHNLLKRGIYKPTRRYCSKIVSAVIVFMVSGLMHEWVVHFELMYKRTQIPMASYYKPTNIVIGTNFAFFAYGFVPVATERSLSKVVSLRMLSINLPRPIKTFIVLMTTLPFVFLFANPYFHGRMFLDYEGLLFRVFKME